MKEKKSPSGLSIIGICLIITFIFIVLKFTETITWSWLWVFSPLWILIIINSFLLLIFGILYCITEKI